MKTANTVFLNKIQYTVQLKTTLLLSFCIATINLASAQQINFSGMGNASSMLYDFWSVFNNQAGLAYYEKPALGISYQNGFLVAETGTQFLGFVYPTKTGNFNAAISRYGYQHYAENTLGIGYSRKLNDLISASVQFDYFYLQQTEAYNNKSLFLVELGIIAEPIENLQIGLHLYNPFRAKIADYQNERLETTVRFGLGYYFEENVLLTLETEKSLEQDIRVKSGLSYLLLEHLFIKAGVITKPNQFTAGLGYKFNKLHFDIAVATHPQLPVSTQASLVYEF